MTADISVIIAAYNVERFIERAIRSALDQRGIAVEVILVDDGSTDATWAIVSKIDDPHLKKIRFPQNAGPSVARNKGMAAASSPWIAILDGDDIFLPDRLARCVALAQMKKADVVVDNIRVYRESDGTTFSMFRPSRFSRLKTLDLAHFIEGNQSFLGGEALGYLKPIFSAAFLQRHGLAYDPELHIGEDYMFLAETLACGAACVVEPSEGYRYTARDGSISHRLSLDGVIRIVDGDKKFLARHTLDPAAAKAQRKRSFHLKEAYAFTKLVDAIKRRDVFAALKIAATRPTALWHLWRPIWARISS
jgi:succinoglycan biosynthesis protein ExoO